MLIVRLGAMGDILHSMPAVTALRRAHPRWFVGWAVEPQWRGLFAAGNAQPRTAGMPLVDRLHVVPAKQWARAPLGAATWAEMRRVRREIRSMRYDLAVDMQGAVRSALIAGWAGSSNVIGEARPREFAARWLFNRQVATHGVHVIEQSAELAEAVQGESLPIPLPMLPCDAAAEAEAAGIREPFVLLSPGAGWGAKRWPADRYGAVARRLAEAGYSVMVNTGPAEEQIVQQVAEASGNAARPLSLDMGRLIAYTRRAALIIAGDTGPLHLACALGRPVVAIFGPTDPARNGPFHSRSVVLRHPDSVRDHTRRSEPEAGLLTITPESVAQAALSLLEAS